MGEGSELQPVLRIVGHCVLRLRLGPVGESETQVVVIECGEGAAIATLRVRLHLEGGVEKLVRKHRVDVEQGPTGLDHLAAILAVERDGGGGAPVAPVVRPVETAAQHHIVQARDLRLQVRGVE